MALLTVLAYGVSPRGVPVPVWCRLPIQLQQEKGKILWSRKSLSGHASLETGSNFSLEATKASAIGAEGKNSHLRGQRGNAGWHDGSNGSPACNIDAAPAIKGGKSEDKSRLECMRDAQESRRRTLLILSQLHPVAACHVICVLCDGISNSIDGIREAVGGRRSEAVQNSIYCLRTLDAAVIILQQVI